jgi:hypothetical protein
MTRTTIQSTDITDGSIVNTDVNASAAIVASKLSGVESGLTSMQTFTSSGTWTKPAGITKVMVEVQGAGGSGAKINGGYVGSGASGGYAKKLIDVSSISSATITVGTGGAAVTATNTSGNSGGSSSWSDGTNTITCNGGSGGDGTTSYKVTAGGTATGGDLNIAGADSDIIRSAGKDSMFGFGGPESSAASNFDGPTSPNAKGYGSGGSSTYLDTSGSGGDGIVIVTEYK